MLFRSAVRWTAQSASCGAGRAPSVPRVDSLPWPAAAERCWRAVELRAPASFTTSPFLLLLAFIPPLASGRTALVLGFSSPTGLAPTPLFVTRRALAVVRPSATGVVSPASSGPSGADSGQFAASVVYQCTSSLFIPPGRPIRTEHHQHPHRPRKTPCTSPPRFCYCLSFSSHPSLLHTHITADFFPTRGAHHRARRALSLRAQRSSSRARPKSPSRASPSGPTRTPTSTRKSFSRCTSTDRKSVV